MIKNGLAEGMVTRKLEAVCGGFGPRFDLVSDLVLFSTNRLKSPNH